MDEADAAQRLDEHARDMAIEKCVSAARSSGGSANCVDCGAAIPQARRDAVPNARRCVRCQEELEDGG